jgi:hypothetical protein
LQAILAMFAEIDKIIDIPMMRVMALVCRHEGENIKELTSRTLGTLCPSCLGLPWI